MRSKGGIIREPQVLLKLILDFSPGCIQPIKRTMCINTIDIYNKRSVHSAMDECTPPTTPVASSSLSSAEEEEEAKKMPKKRAPPKKKEQVMSSSSSDPIVAKKNELKGKTNETKKGKDTEVKVPKKRAPRTGTVTKCKSNPPTPSDEVPGENGGISSETPATATVLTFADRRVRNGQAFATEFGNDALGKNIEICVYNYTLRESARYNIVRKSTSVPFMVAYNNRLRSIWWNIQSNPSLRQSIADGRILPLALETMTQVELNMSHWKDEIVAKTKRDQSRFVVNQRATTSVYTCGKCKSNSCVFHSVQIRSSDEPMTVFVTCLDCGKNWKN